MKLPLIPLVVLDTETTGFVPRTHRVIEFASAEIRDGKIVKEYEQLFACDEVPPHVEVLTRINTEDLTGKPTFKEKLEEVLAHLPADAVIVGQNITFDLGMLKGEGIDLTERPWIDTSMLASLVFPELHSYSLGYLSRVLELKHDPPHRALGDVRATLALLEKCWERLTDLPDAMNTSAKDIMARSAPGYRMLFADLPASKKKDAPAWLGQRPSYNVEQFNNLTIQQSLVKAPKKGEVELLEEPLDPAYLHSLIRAAIAEKSITHWIAVKNLRAARRRLPPDLLKAVGDGDVRVLQPTQFLLNGPAVKEFLSQEVFTADEATLAVKLEWYEPGTRDDLPIHGGEDAVWNGKLACTEDSPRYIDQFSQMPGVILLDHRELLHFLGTPDHPARRIMSGSVHIIIDDASMLEDTATKAYGWHCNIPALRAAAEGDALLTRLTDLLQLWIEKTRQSQDIRYIAENDVRTIEAKGLRKQLEEVLASKEWPEKTKEQLLCIQKVLEPANLGGRITWIEIRQNGTQTLESVPERIGTALGQTLYNSFPVTLLIPQRCGDMLPEILPLDVKTRVVELPKEAEHAWRNSLPLSMKSDPLEDLFHSPPPGKTVVLLPGRSTIEDLFVKYTEKLEAQGVTLICQGLAGGQGRMQAEFLAAESPVLWLLTPWMFEGIELPPDTIDHLVLKTLPFDHPKHPVMSRRSSRYADAFADYALPRLIHRLFRLLRTYSRFKTPTGDVRVLDERLFSKSYGKKVQEYLSTFNEVTGLPVTPSGDEGQLKKPAAKKDKPDKPQLQLF